MNNGADVANLVPKTCHFACLLRPISHLGGPSSESGELGSTRRETFGFQAWISVDLEGISGPPLNQAFGVGSVAKTIFSRMLGFC